MQFDLRKFIVSGTKPYAAEFQCDLSAKDFAGARIEQPVTARFEAVPDGEEIRMTLRANALVHGECARCLDPVEREETVQAVQERAPYMCWIISGFPVTVEAQEWLVLPEAVVTVAHT